MNFRQILLKLAFNKNHIKTHFLNRMRDENSLPNIKHYLMTLYDGIESWKEGIYAIRYGITEHPVCAYCGKPVSFRMSGKYYPKHCSFECQGLDNNVQEKRKETLRKLYGVEYNFQRDDVKKKIEDKMLEKYGNRKFFASDYAKSDEFRKLKEEGCLKKYGTKYYVHSNEYKERIPEIQKKVQETMIKRYGVNSYPKTKEYLEKEYKTKKKNHTFSSSKPEEEMYKQLCDIFGVDNIKRQYKCDRYPWNCDFYIIPKDLFIELQGFYTHHTHPFDPNNVDDQNKLADLKRRNYRNVICGWTVRDPMKRNKAKENNLNYIEFFDYNPNLLKTTLDNYKGGYLWAC